MQEIADLYCFVAFQVTLVSPEHEAPDGFAVHVAVPEAVECVAMLKSKVIFADMGAVLEEYR